MCKDESKNSKNSIKDQNLTTLNFLNRVPCLNHNAMLCCMKSVLGTSLPSLMSSSFNWILCLCAQEIPTNFSYLERT